MKAPVLRCLLAGSVLALAACQHKPSGFTVVDMMVAAEGVEVGRVSAHGVWSTRNELWDAGIAVYADEDYPDYRLLVAPENRRRALKALREIKARPTSATYGIRLE